MRLTRNRMGHTTSDAEGAEARFLVFSTRDGIAVAIGSLLRHSEERRRAAPFGINKREEGSLPSDKP
jgi:hypothetical protein